MRLSNPEPPSFPLITSPHAPTGAALMMPSFRTILFNLSAFAGLVAIPVTFILVSLLISLVSKQITSLAVFLVGYIGVVIFLVVYPTIFVIQLKSVKGVEISLGKALGIGLHYVPRIVVLGLLLLMLFGFGLILFVVPGVIFIKRYFLAPYHLIDKDLGILKAMEASAQESKGYGLTIWGVIGFNIFFCAFIVVPLIGWEASIILLLLYSCAPAICYENITIARHLPKPFQNTLKK